MKANYKNGNVYVSIDLHDGTKERFTKEDEFRPEFAESMDVNITNYCDGGCTMCYAGCTKEGKHSDLLSDYVVNTFIPSLMPYTELAINGNDLSHPQLEPFLQLLKEHKVIANITVNQKHFMKNLGKLSQWTDLELVHGIGVSLSDSSDKEFIKEVKRFPNAVIHVIAGIFTPEDIMNLQFNDLKILILGYKKKGRGVEWYDRNEYQIEKLIALLHVLLPSMINMNTFKVISFDNLAIKQLKLKEILSPEMWNEFYMGDDGSFTFYVDLVSHSFSVSSISTILYDIGTKSAKDMFECVRRYA